MFLDGLVGENFYDTALDLLNATVSGLTINDFVETSLIHPLFSKFVISEATKSLFSSDDLLLFM
jgi:hypothetical protein